MISRDPNQRRLYEARLKMERDARATLAYAREEGREEGREESKRQERCRTVKILRDIAGDSVPTDDELLSLSLDDLALIELELQCRLRERN